MPKGQSACLTINNCRYSFPCPHPHTPRPSVLPQLGELVRAVEDYSAALAVDPASSYAHYNRGITRDRLQVGGEALLLHTSNGWLRLNSAVHQRGLHRHLLMEGQTSCAPLAQLNVCLYIHSNVVPACPSECSQDYAGAVEDFTCAIRLEPGNADFYHNRGFALRKMVRGLGRGTRHVPQTIIQGCRRHAVH